MRQGGRPVSLIVWNISAEVLFPGGGSTGGSLGGCWGTLGAPPLLGPPDYEVD